MRKLVLVVAGALLWVGLQALIPTPADAALEVSVSGSVRLNVLWSDRVFVSGQDVPSPADIPFDSGPARVPERDHSMFTLDARRVRLQVDAKDEVAGVKLAARVQGDFDTTDGNARVSNSRHFRVRLAYGQGTTPGGFTLRFGQTRTIVSEYGDNLIGGVGVGGELNENGLFSQLQGRQPAIHAAWMGKVGPGDITIGVGVEKNSFNNLGSALVAEDQGEGQDLPLVGGGVRFRSPWFAVFARAAGSRVKVILPGTSAVSESVWLGAIGADVTPIQMLRIYGQYYYSDGLSRAAGVFADGALCTVAAVCTVGKIETLKSQAAHFGVQLLPTKDIELNAIGTWVKADDDLVRGAGASFESSLKRVRTIQFNVIQKFWTRMDWGVEYVRAWVDSFGVSEGKAHYLVGRLRFYF